MISSYQPCQMQIDTSEEIKKRCTRIIAILKDLIQEKEDHARMEPPVEARNNLIQNSDLLTQPENTIDERVEKSSFCPRPSFHFNTTVEMNKINQVEMDSQGVGPHGSCYDSHPNNTLKVSVTGIALRLATMSPRMESLIQVHTTQ